MAINPYNNGPMPPKPFGNIYTVQTPRTNKAVDDAMRVSQQMAAFKMQMAQKKAEELDKDFERQSTGIRDADVEDVANAYSDYASAKKKLLFDPSLQKDPVARAKAEIEANKKLAQYHATVQESKTAVGYFKNLNGGMIKKPYDYREDAQDMLNSANNLSTKQLKEQGLLNGEAWMEQDEDLNPVEKLARGKDREFTVVTEPDANGGLTRRSLTYSAPNEPRAFQMGWLTGLNTKRKVGTLVRDFDRNVSDAEFAAAETEYRNALQDKGRWAKWGIAPQPINYDPNSEVEKAVAYKTYRHFLDNEPVAKKETNVANTDKVIDKNFANRLKAMAIAQGYKKELMGLREALKKKGEDDTWAFQATDAYEGEDPAKLQDVMQRLFAGNKTGITLGQIKQAPDGGMVVPITRKVKGPYGQMVDQYEEVSFQKGDPMNVYKFAKLQQTVLGMPAKMVQALGTGRTANRATKPTGASTVPGKKTKTFKGVPKGGF